MYLGSNQSLEVVLGAAHATAALPVVVSLAATDATATVVGGNTAATNGLAAVTIAGPPAAGEELIISGITIYNADTIEHSIRPRYNDNATIRQIGAVAVPPGRTLQYTSQQGWSIIPTGDIKHKAKMSRAVTQIIANLTETKIAFDTEDYDIGGIADLTTDVFTIVRAGIYLCQSYLVGNTIDDAELIAAYIYLNGALVAQGVGYCSVDNGYPTALASAVLSLAVGDSLEMRVIHNEGAAMNTLTDVSSRPSMTVTEL